ncbi:MAG: ribosome assembly RNA-binding protein YhbY [bacterium]|nr:ribosome assembly RNA-binding protein YhbY [bacterium]
MKLSAKKKIYLKSLAHELQPMVFVGKNGITEALTTAVNTALDDHELIKLKFQAFKEEKKDLTTTIVEESGAELIGRVGNIAILYRQNKDPEKRKVKIPAHVK